MIINVHDQLIYIMVHYLNQQKKEQCKLNDRNSDTNSDLSTTSEEDNGKQWIGRMRGLSGAKNGKDTNIYT